MDKLGNRQDDARVKRESDLYAPIKALLTRQGFDVKGEVGAADLVARRDDMLVIVELKLKVSLTLYHQAISRLKLTDHVYIAVPRPRGRQSRRMMRDNMSLCRRLGLGYMTVHEDGRVDVICDPGPYAPRKNTKARDRLLREFDRLTGDPNDGGATRHGIVTAYRQDALRCAAYLAEAGAEKGALVAKATGVAKATTVMRDNHYGWFDKVEKGIYALNEDGRAALVHWAYSWEDREA